MLYRFVLWSPLLSVLTCLVIHLIHPITFRCSILKRVPNSALWLLRFPAAGERRLRDCMYFINKKLLAVYSLKGANGCVLFFFLHIHAQNEGNYYWSPQIMFVPQKLKEEKCSYIQQNHHITFQSSALQLFGRNWTFFGCMKPLCYQL